MAVGRPRGGGGGGQRGGRGRFRAAIAAVVPLLVCVGAGLSWGTGNVVSRSAAGANGFGIVVWSALVVPLPVLGLSLILDGPAVVGEAFTSIGWQTIVSVAYTAGFASLVGYSVNMLLGRYPAGVVAPFAPRAARRARRRRTRARPGPEPGRGRGSGRAGRRRGPRPAPQTAGEQQHRPRPAGTAITPSPVDATAAGDRVAAADGR